MNILTGILSREKISSIMNLNIIWMSTENKSFLDFFNTLGHNLIPYNDLYFGYNQPHLIICNNKLYQYSECLSISLKYHLPSLIIDHAPKHSMLDPDKIEDLHKIPSSYKIAINQKIFDSWEGIHDVVLGYDANNKENIDKWQNILYKLSQGVFKLV